MLVFFGLTSLVGLGFMAINHAAQTPDSIPRELCTPPAAGLLLAFVGLVGFGCVLIF